MVGNSRFQKKANRALILNYLFNKGSISRNILAKELGLQASTVTNIVQELIEKGLAAEYKMEGIRTHSSGRKPIGIGLSPLYGCVIGIDLQVDYYITIIYDFAGRLKSWERVTYKRRYNTFTDLLSHTVNEICRSQSTPVLGVGLALPGIINGENKIIVDCWTHNLKNCDLRAWLKENFPFPVLMDNDANCAALSLLKYHSNESYVYLLPRFHNPVLVPETQPSVGIGMGLVINGKLHRGKNFMAGEFQSIFSSSTKNHSRQLSLPDNVLDRAFKSIEIQKEIMAELMESMILILKILDPRSLIIGGDLCGRKKELDLILQKEERNSPYSIEVREEGSIDSAIGAGTLVFEKLFFIPQVGSNKKEN